jgi:hypothetical protein
MASQSQHTQLRGITRIFHDNQFSYSPDISSSHELTGDPDTDYISKTWSIYTKIHDLTRKPKVYESTPAIKLDGCGVNAEDFLWGIPRDDLLRGLLWHAVYKPFWNERAEHSPMAPSWSWVSLNQQVGWPDYSGGGVRDDVVHVEDLTVGEIEADRERVTSSSDLGLGKASRLSLIGDGFPATFELHNNTKRKGSLTGSALRKTLACTMDCDFDKRRVFVLKVLTRQLDDEMFRTLFLVLEAFLSDDQPKVSAGHENVSDDRQEVSIADIAACKVLIAKDSEIYRRVGTAKLNHRAKESSELRRASQQRARITIV